jgi:hypothetical protein
MGTVRCGIFAKKHRFFGAGHGNSRREAKNTAVGHVAAQQSVLNWFYKSVKHAIQQSGDKGLRRISPLDGGSPVHVPRMGGG